MEEMRSLGVQVSRTARSSSTSIQLGAVSVPLSSFVGEEVVARLPAPAKAQLVFTRESAVSRVSKLLWPELVLGDAEVDDLVVARTTTEAETRAVMADPAARGFVLDVIAGGGTVTIAGDLVTAMIPEGSGVGDDALVAFVRAVLA